MPPLKTIGGIGAVLTCPCHAVPLVLFFGGAAGSAWLTRHFPVLLVSLGLVFLVSLWLLLRPDSNTKADVKDTALLPERDDVLRRS